MFTKSHKFHNKKTKIWTSVNCSFVGGKKIKKTKRPRIEKLPKERRKERKEKEVDNWMVKDDFNMVWFGFFYMEMITIREEFDWEWGFWFGFVLTKLFSLLKHNKNI